MYRHPLLFAFLAALPFTVPAAAGPLAPSNLLCEYMKNPMGVDAAQPRFFWTLEHTARGEKQTAYQVVVEPGWDSGKVVSSESTQVAYKGPALRSGATYRWKVRYWDKEGNASPWSATASFDTGLLTASDWKAKWIGGGNQLRKQFDLPSAPVRARAYVSGLGYYELYLNGQKVGDHVLDPGWTTWRKRVLYAVYDVTPLLVKGPNAVGLMLGQGWFKNRIGLVQMKIELAGGQTVEITSDGSWKATDGPIVEDSLYNGESYDARRETPGWDRGGYDDSSWHPAKLVQAPEGVLSTQTMPPIRVTGGIQPFKLTNPKPGVFVYDMGQNFSGVVRLRVRGPRGTTVRLRHAELLYDDGTLNVENLRSARATDYYTLRGDGEEVYQPRFTYHGFRYVEVTGYPGTPKLGTITGLRVHSDVKPTGGFACSKPILNQLQRIIIWGIQSNLESVPTDCNQRDERMGWMADAHLYSESAMMNYDMPAFYSNFVRNIRDNQETHPDGSVSDTVPHERFVSGPADPAWGSAYPLFVWYIYERYGDRRLLEENFEGIRKWADSLKAKSEGDIVNFYKYGDWVPVERTPGNLVSTFFYCWSVDIVAQAAEVLGKTTEAAQYRQLGQEIRAAFHKKFFNPEIGAYGNGSQTSQVLPLFLNMVPKEGSRAMGYLKSDIVYMKNTHLFTGIIGTKYAMPLLTRSGSPDLAYELATQTSYPSWGFMIKNGATTLWELWQNKTGPSMNSHNHPMFGGVGAWMYEALAGINYDVKAPGYRHIEFRPEMVRDLNWANGSIETPRGMVASSWRREPGVIHMEVDVPVGSVATVVLPKLKLEEVEVTEGGRSLWRNGAYQPGVEGVDGASETPAAITIRCGSGHYAFELRGK